MLTSVPVEHGTPSFQAPSVNIALDWLDFTQTSCQKPGLKVKQRTRQDKVVL